MPGDVTLPCYTLCEEQVLPCCARQAAHMLQNKQNTFIEQGG